jgi:hypothetical protein
MSHKASAPATESVVKRLVSCGEVGHCVESMRLGDVELLHTSDFSVAGKD